MQELAGLQKPFRLRIFEKMFGQIDTMKKTWIPQLDGRNARIFGVQGMTRRREMIRPQRWNAPSA